VRAVKADALTQEARANADKDRPAFDRLTHQDE
jgi:hypothetical protein